MACAFGAGHVSNACYSLNTHPKFVQIERRKRIFEQEQTHVPRIAWQGCSNINNPNIMKENYKTVSKLLFPDEQALSQTPTQNFEDLLRNQLHSMRNERMRILNPEPQKQDFENENYKDIADFIKDHVLSVGKEQAVKDFQCGLNFLHKDLVESLNEDGNFGEKTFKAFYEILKHYDISIIKNAIRKGALSNTLIDTSSDKNINTQALVNQIQNNLGGIK